MPGPSAFIRQQCPNATLENDGLMTKEQAQLVAAGGADLGNDNAAALGTAAPGISPQVSRKDHVHPLPANATDTVAGLFAAFDKKVHAGFHGEHICANHLAGADIGAKINAAIAQLAGKPGTVYTLASTTGYVIETQVIVEENVTISLGTATYDCTHTGLTNPTLPVFLMKSNTSVESTQKWGAVLIEPPTYSDVCITFRDYPAAFDGNAKGTDNIHIRDIVIIGRSGNVHTGVTAAIHFGNCQNISVQGCKFKLNAGYAVSAGGAAASGFHANTIVIRDNLMIDVHAQNIAVVNGSNLIVDGNIMRRETVETAQTFIDCETNVTEDEVHLFTITNNLIEAAGGDYFTGSVGIAVLGGVVPANPGITSRGIIAHNIINGYKEGVGEWYLATGINVLLAQSVMVFGNSITKCGQGGITLIASQDCEAFDNDINESGGQPPPDGNSNPINLFGSKYCHVTDNRIRNYTGATGNTPSIFESSANAHYGEVCDYNLIANNHLYQRSTAPGPALGIISNIATTGANTRCFNNTINGLPVDDPMIATVAELRTVPYPGTRHASKPPFVRLAGQTTFNDGLGGAWYFDFASSTADNGTSVIAPALFPTAITAGRWRRL